MLVGRNRNSITATHRAARQALRNEVKKTHPDARKFVDDFITDWRNNPYDYRLSGTTSEALMTAVCQADPYIRRDVVIICFDQMFEANSRRKSKYSIDQKNSDWHICDKLASRAKFLLQSKLPFEQQSIVVILAACITMQDPIWLSFPIRQLIKALNLCTSGSELEPDARELLVALRPVFGNGNSAEGRRFGFLIDRMLQVETLIPDIKPGEAWSDAALGDLSRISGKLHQNLNALLYHCMSASAPKPSKKWQREARVLLDAIGTKQFVMSVLRWFPLVDKPRTQPLAPNRYRPPEQNLLITDGNAEILKGLVWCCSLIEPEAGVMRELCALAITAYKKVSGKGARCVKLGNACVYALGAIPSEDAIGQLAILNVKINIGSARKQIDKALTIAADRLNVPRDEIEEMAVPAYGLSDVGVLRKSLGDFTADLRITGTNSTELRWIRVNGKIQKSVPAAIKRDYADELKELKQSAKDVRKILPAQRDRIDNLYLQQRSWTYNTWAERYLNHALIGTLARRLIWSFQNGDVTTSAIWHEDRFIDHHSQQCIPDPKNTTVTLWHPIDHEEETIVAWRVLLEEKQIQQPFKQAHREVYLLTDAEREAEVYSNRYAAHLLRQHQFNALCSVRNWKNRLRLLVDDEYQPATRYLDLWNLRAEFWIEGAGEDYGDDTNDGGVYLYLATDQVRFYQIDAPLRTAHAYGGGYETHGAEGSDNPIPLRDVPPMVFSEIMRDVDLFVGVASVGNDPNWADGGPEGRYRQYWYGYSFGDLSQTATTRLDILKRIVPKLKIADRCSFDDRSLIVRGDLHTYKIHCGSANVLMEPNDQYLCIVGGGSRQANSIFLPFEGDTRLAVILSKAFLLADDTVITDRSIISQIKRKL